MSNDGLPEGSHDLDKLTDRTKFKEMVHWFTPGLLAQAGFHAIVASLFGQYADQRTTQHLTDPIPDPTDGDIRVKQQNEFVTRYDYSAESIAGEPFWADFGADLGDGFDTTYAVAHMMAADHLYPEKKAVGLNAGAMEVYGLHGGEPLPGGRVLVLGGDEVYPWPSREEYENRFSRPYRIAYPEFEDHETGPEALRARKDRDIFAIPGNHDWYDGLGAFDDLFCRARSGEAIGRQSTRIGGWQTRQHRSYFAIKLPHNWWIWGADVQLGRYLDTGQLEYFRTVAEHMGPGHKFILCTAQPSWYSFGTGDESLARSNLHALIDMPIRRGAKICGIFSGDSHHYSRYNESEKLGNFNLITAGGAGAYTHGTYHLRPEIKFHWVDRFLNFSLQKKLKPGRPNLAQRAAARVEPEAQKPLDLSARARELGDAIMADAPPPPPAVTQDAGNPPISAHMKPKQTKQPAVYPSKTTSRIIAWSNFAFPFRNKSFSLTIAFIYLLLTWTFSVLEVGYSIDLSYNNELTADNVYNEQLNELRSKLNKRGGLQNLPPSDDFIGPPAGPAVPQTKLIEAWTLDVMDIYAAEVKSVGITTAAGIKALLVFFGRSIQLLLLGIVFSLPAMAFMFGMWALFVTIAESKLHGRANWLSRVTLGTLHFMVHLIAMWGLYAATLYFNTNVLKPWLEANISENPLNIPMAFWTRAAAVPEFLILGMLIGGLIFGLYLTVTYHFAKTNSDWVFSSQRIKNYKCFLRMKFEEDRLTIYPIGLHNVPSSGRWRSAWQPRKPDGTSRSLLRPVRKLRPHLIEGPIVINVDEVNNIPRD